MSPADILTTLAASGQTLAFAESLTGGLLADAFISIPGASVSVRGGIIAYSTDLKSTLLGVDPGLLALRGAVDGEVAEQMATGVRAALGAEWGVSTTGVAGPGDQGGTPVGTVYIGLARAGASSHSRVQLAGGRREIRAGAVAAAITALAGGVASGTPE